ncbi:MAG: molybdenum cofactor guanylyltransferase [Syntrophus sp. (in: bacteria)]|nr:molybdenum cofactor guanylyltransferase [Syntrophus sp. (in: bacteria)]
MNQGSFHDITGVILVGGKSRRMGRDKAFLQIAGKTLFERVLEIFRESFDRLLLVGDRAERFAGYALPVLPDIYPGSALGGLYTALYHAETEYIFVSSCDLPFPNREILLFLCSHRDGFDAAVPNPAHGFEPLFALYAKSCLGPMRELLESGNRCVYDFYPRVRVRYVHGEELDPLDRDGRSFMNVNTPEEFEKIKTGGSP